MTEVEFKEVCSITLSLKEIANALKDIKAQIAISNKLKLMELQLRRTSISTLREFELMIDRNEATERVFKSPMPIMG